MRKIQSFYPTLGQSWAVAAILLAGSFGVSAVFLLIKMVMEQVGRQSFEMQSWTMLISYLLPFLLVAGFIYLLQYGATADAPPAEKKRVAPPVFLLLLVFTPLLALVIEPLTSWLPMPEFIKNMFEGSFQRDLPTLFMAVAAAPLCEEWLCRGVIAKGLLRHTTPGKAIFWSAFLFAFIHMNPWQAVPAFIIGLLLGYVYWKTQSLWPCVFIHFVNNGASFLLLYLFPEMDANASVQSLLGDRYIYVYPAALTGAASAGWLLYMVLQPPKQRQIEEGVA
jgi:membrane protease YdiL (CAAX protease family)